MSKYYKTLVYEDYNDEELFYKISDYYYLKVPTEEDFQKFDEIEKNFFVVVLLLSEVNSGGFEFYFVDAGGEKYAEHTLDFLTSIDEDNFSHLLNKAMNIFKSEKEYNEIVKDLDKIDSEFYNFTGEYNDLYKKCIIYLKDRANKI